MPRRHIPERITAVLAGCLLVACAQSPADSDPTSDQAAGYRADVREIDTAARQYDMAIAKTSQELCIAIHRTYNLKVREILQRIDLIDEPLDATITAHGGAAYADLVCTTQAIVTELDYHGAVACQELTIEDNQLEAARHLLALGALLEHALARIAEIETGLAGAAPAWTWSVGSACP